MNTFGRVVGSAAAGMLVTGGLVAGVQPAAARAATGPAAQRAAVVCTWTHQYNDTIVGRVKGNSARPMRVGPYDACGVVAMVSVGTPINFHCSTRNTYGNWWTYVSAGGYSGWMWDGYLTPNGANGAC